MTTPTPQDALERLRDPAIDQPELDAAIATAAAALAASEARIKELQFALHLAAEAAEQSLAEAVKDAARYRYLCECPEGDAAMIAWNEAYSALGGPYVKEYIDAAIDAMLPKGDKP